MSSKKYLLPLSVADVIGPHKLSWTSSRSCFARYSAYTKNEVRLYLSGYIRLTQLCYLLDLWQTLHQLIPIHLAQCSHVHIAKSLMPAPRCLVAAAAHCQANWLCYLDLKHIQSVRRARHLCQQLTTRLLNPHHNRVDVNFVTDLI